MELQVEKYQSGDEEDIVELLQLAFSGWPHFDLNCTPLEHWKWKFLENIHTRNTTVKATSNDKIVGCFHGLELYVKIGDNIFLVSNGVDLGVHPDYRRMGIYNKMFEARLELRLTIGIKMVIWSSSNPIILESSRRRKNPDRLLFPKPLSLLVRIQDLDLHFRKNPSSKSLKYRIGYPIINAINRFSNLLKSPIRTDAKMKISQIKRFDDKIIQFWEEVSNEYSFIFERKKAYLNWRYSDPRAGNYVIYLAEDDERILGYCVVRINKYDLENPKGYIMDLLALNDRSDVIEQLILKCVNHFDENEVNIIQCLCVKNSIFEKCLRQFGFLDSRWKKYVAISLRGVGSEEIENFSRDIILKKLHLVQGDFDDI